MQMGPAPALAGTFSAEQVRMGQRVFGNLHEQSIVFVVGLWMMALFGDVAVAAQLGWVWLGLRCLYVIIWALTGGNIIPGILISTMPQCVRRTRAPAPAPPHSLPPSLVSHMHTGGAFPTRRRYGIVIWLYASVAAPIDLKALLMDSDAAGWWDRT